MGNTITNQAIDKLANTMRLYAEASFKFNSLKKVDTEEAINNLDRAFEAKLESFHSLYDVTQNINGFDYFNSADTALLILLRNAIHHRDHTLFNTWNYEMNLNGGLERSNGAEFLLASHSVTNTHAPFEDAITGQVYYKLDDFFDRLRDPKVKRMMGKHADEKIEKLSNQLKSDLGVDVLLEHSSKNRYPRKQIYINIIPIFMSAFRRVLEAFDFKSKESLGYDSDVYIDHMRTMVVNFSEFNYKPVRINLT
jgi:hypothetical protein